MLFVNCDNWKSQDWHLLRTGKIPKQLDINKQIPVSVNKTCAADKPTRFAPQILLQLNEKNRRIRYFEKHK